MKDDMLNALVLAAQYGRINFAHLDHLAQQENVALPRLLDRLAELLARRYLDGRISHADAETLVTAAYAVTCSDRYARRFQADDGMDAEDGNADALFDVVIAFDAGDFRPPAERPLPADPFPLEPQGLKTRAMLEQFLMMRGAPPLDEQ